MATTHTASGKFYTYYRALRRARRLDTTPVLISEGDSWFSMPLYYNLIDWLEISAREAAFLRMESSGDLATRMFRGKSLKNIERRLKEIPFDALLVSGGGNDFVAEFLKPIFRDEARLTVDQALARIRQTGRFDEVLNAYRRMIDTALAVRPNLNILGHGYDYPLLMSAPARLRVEQIGLIALLKREVGDWIGRHLQHALPDLGDQRAFARGLIDDFHDRVLQPLAGRYPGRFHFVDFRGMLSAEQDWNDEMHPTAEGFQELAGRYRETLRDLLPEAKRDALGPPS